MSSWEREEGHRESIFHNTVNFNGKGRGWTGWGFSSFRPPPTNHGRDNNCCCLLGTQSVCSCHVLPPPATPRVILGSWLWLPVSAFVFIASFSIIEQCTYRCRSSHPLSTSSIFVSRRIKSGRRPWGEWQVELNLTVLLLHPAECLICLCNCCLLISVASPFSSCLPHSRFYTYFSRYTYYMYVYIASRIQYTYIYSERHAKSGLSACLGQVLAPRSVHSKDSSGKWQLGQRVKHSALQLSFHFGFCTWAFREQCCLFWPAAKEWTWVVNAREIRVNNV